MVDAPASSTITANRDAQRRVITVIAYGRFNGDGVTRVRGVPLAGRWRVSDVRVASAEARVTIYNRVR